MKINKIVFIFLLCILFYGCKKEELVITQANFAERVVKEFANFLETEGTSTFFPLFVFFDSHPDLVITDAVKSKFLYLRAVNSFITLRSYKNAENYYLEAFELAEKINDYDLKGMVLNDRGALSRNLLRPPSYADKLYFKAIENYKRTQNISKLIETYYNLASNSIDMKKWNSSIKYAKECVKLIGDNKKLHIYYCRVYYFLAHSNINLGKFSEAASNLDALEKLLRENTFNNIIRTKAYMYESKSDLEAAKGNYKAAIYNSKEALAYRERLRIEIRNTTGKAYDRELILKTELQKEKDIIITDQKKMLLLSLLALFLLSLLIISLVFFMKKNENKNKEIRKLNTSLESLVVSLKEKNIDLSNKRIEIEELLKLNEQALFSRVFKISTYNDAIQKIIKSVESYIDKNTNVARFLKTVNKELKSLISEEELWEDFKIQFEKNRPDFFDKLKQVAPKLSINDLKHCTYIVSNLKSKEVAKLINVSPRSVETTRYRIKKKMGLDKEDLYTVLSNL